ncbi:hypothetical protein [Leucobacter sp. GX24907]
MRRIGRCAPLAGAGAALALCLLLTGCEITVPADPDGVLDRIEATGVLRAGASETRAVQRSGDRATGPLADTVERFAREHGAEVEWEFDSEESLVDELEARRLDLAIGGFTADTLWVDRAGVSRPYPEFDAAPREGESPRELVLLVPLGQNRLLSKLETLADEEAGR